ncbi:tetratricopeptide repeat protein [Chitinophaga sp. RAB17]|uniref:tetratricopeptide repeat protein n=1 Tax=Chitinophaga sp. RAB17 TaxID=3233049 RepID=UPI003F93BF03
MEIRDQKIIAAIEAIWQESEVLFENNDLARYAQKLEEAWDLLPSPKTSYDDSFHLALSIAETYLELKDFPAMLRWAKTLQQCDLERADDGDREFMLGKAFYENGSMTEAEQYLNIAMQKSGGRVFEGADEKYLHVFQGLASVVEESLPDEVYEKIETLSEEGNVLADEENYDAALAKFTEALQLLPEPKHEWEASTWLNASIGDMLFFKADYSAAANSFFDALNGPDAQAVGFVQLRLGECLYELKQEEQALEHLLRAYMLEGAEIFTEEDPRYLDFLKARVEL